ncbi:MAG TPA: glutamine-hydrolyzing GMP synthase [Armatimonadota bacterium]|nr:glutamine-hydrolyzing GMP synthase [Armatimonadota bacterium]
MTCDHDELVVVLDFGAQYAQLIARRIRECRVYSEIVPCDRSAADILALRPAGIVLSGGPASVYAEGSPRCDPALWHAGIPMLGICYGMQLMAKELGGEVAPTQIREYGRTELRVESDADLLRGLGDSITAWMSHGDAVLRPPAGFHVAARTSQTAVGAATAVGAPTIAAIADPARRLFGVQFHPEVVHTPRGMDIFRNFLYQQCGCHGRWTPASIIEESCRAIREQAGESRVLCGLSGGVDSSVLAALGYRAIGDRLVCVFVDHGLLRAGEGEQVRETFTRHFPVDLHYVEAQERFLTALAGVTDPEQKRIIIGREFIAVFEEEARKHGDIRLLAQGTLYPDVIESGTGSAAVIKSHHNVGGLPEKMGMKLVEPLRNLFKDEVRAVGHELGLPDEIVWRQPFPGPGLAVRILGEITRERLETSRQVDKIIIDEITRAGLYRKLFQAFGVLAPIRSVGVMGDQRTYGETAIVRAVAGDDAMTADWADLPHEVLAAIANRIVNEVAGITRVVYDITSKPPATIEWE